VDALSVASAAPNSIVGDPNTFTGRYWDPELGVYFYRERQLYNPMIGRFEQEDPIGQRGGINLFAYAADSPMNFKDPDGTQTFSGGLLRTPIVPVAPPIVGRRKHGGAGDSNSSTPPVCPAAGSGGGNNEECELNAFLSVLFKQCTYICNTPPIFEFLPKPTGGLGDCQPYLLRF
jgi:RHS repeat-associated protein